MSTRLSLAALAVVTAVLGTIYAVGFGPLQMDLAGGFCDEEYVTFLADEAKADGAEVDYRYRNQEVVICIDPASTTDDAPDDDNDGVPNDTDVCEDTPAGVDVYTEGDRSGCPKEEETPTCSAITYLADEPLAEQQWLNSYAGNPVARHPDFAGKAMSELSVEEALRENEHRRSFDPMLTTADAVTMGLTPDMNEDDQLAFTRQLAADCAAWTTLNDRITKFQRDNCTNRIEHFEPGVYEAAYALSDPEGDDVPIIAWDTHVNRPEGFNALVSECTPGGAGDTTESVIRRLECGFQEYTRKPQESSAAATTANIADGARRLTLLPEPAPGLARTPEGVPEVDQEQTPTTSSSPTSSAPTTPATETSTPTTGTPGQGGGECPEGQMGTPPNCKDTPAADPGNNGNGGYEGGAEEGGSDEGLTTDPGAGQPPDEYVVPDAPAGNDTQVADGAEPATGGDSADNQGAAPTDAVTTDPCESTSPPAYCG